MEEFYIGSGDVLYLKRENGSLARFALRVTPEGLKCFDQMMHEWYDVPALIAAQGKPDVRVTVEVLDGS